MKAERNATAFFYLGWVTDKRSALLCHFFNMPHGVIWKSKET
jgi:hypothetical protein